MGAQIVRTSMALGAEHDLINPTEARLYPLGYEIQIENPETTMISKFIYVRSHTTLVAYRPYQLAASSTAGSEVITAAPKTGGVAAPGALIVIPQVAFTSGYYGFVLLEGYGKGNTTETLTAGDYLQVISAGTTFILDGSNGNSPYSANTSVMALAAGTIGSTSATAMMLLRGKSVIAAT